MKATILTLFIVLFLFSCNENNNTKNLEARIDRLEKKLDDTYKPGFGEFMSQIQVHHAKLWFAGLSENWKLADFEIHEMMEAVDGIKKYDTDRSESKSVSMIEPALDSTNIAIQEKNLSHFENDFSVLTNTCNNCHRAVHYPFNDVKIPETPPFSNQVFKTPGK